MSEAIRSSVSRLDYQKVRLMIHSSPYFRLRPIETESEVGLLHRAVTETLERIQELGHACFYLSGHFEPAIALLRQSTESLLHVLDKKQPVPSHKVKQGTETPQTDATPPPPDITNPPIKKVQIALPTLDQLRDRSKQPEFSPWTSAQVQTRLQKSKTHFKHPPRKNR